MSLANHPLFCERVSVGQAFALSLTVGDLEPGAARRCQRQLPGTRRQRERELRFGGQQAIFQNVRCESSRKKLERFIGEIRREKFLPCCLLRTATCYAAAAVRMMQRRSLLRRQRNENVHAKLLSTGLRSFARSRSSEFLRFAYDEHHLTDTRVSVNADSRYECDPERKIIQNARLTTVNQLNVSSCEQRPTVNFSDNSSDKWNRDYTRQLVSS